MSADQKRQLFDNIAAAVQGVPQAILRRQILPTVKASPSGSH
jgi:catalase